MVRLYRTDWDRLDTLLGKVGFGGYYDFLEVLKVGGYKLVETKVKEEDKEKWKTTIREETDLKTLVHLINHLIFRKDEK